MLALTVNDMLTDLGFKNSVYNSGERFGEKDFQREKINMAVIFLLNAKHIVFVIFKAELICL